MWKQTLHCNGAFLYHLAKLKRRSIIIQSNFYFSIATMVCTSVFLYPEAVNSKPGNVEMPSNQPNFQLLLKSETHVVLEV